MASKSFKKAWLTLNCDRSWDWMFINYNQKEVDKIVAEVKKIGAGFVQWERMEKIQ